MVEASTLYRPPAAPLRVGPLQRLGNIAAFRRNMLSVFSEIDYRREASVFSVLRRKVIVVNDPDLVREALIANHDVLQTKSPQMRHALKPLLGDGLFVSDGQTWRNRRAIVAPIVHASQIDTFAPVMTEVAQEWCDQLSSRSDIDMLREMAEMTAEVISRAVFGRRLGRRYTSEIVAGFSDYQARVDQLNLSALIGLPDWLPSLQSLRVAASTRRIHRVLDDIMAQYRRQAREGCGDDHAVIGKLFLARDVDGHPLPDEAIRNEAAVLFMAGHETTANTLAWAWRLLAGAPWALTRLQDEIDTVLGGRQAVFRDLPDLPYARAVIEETMRLYPPVPLLAREAAAPIRIGPHAAPKGALVVVAPWLLHRNPRLWRDPDVFDPERFDPRLSRRPEKYAYIPFAAGPRVCPGMVFGLTEAVLCLVHLAQRLTFTLDPGHETVLSCRMTLRPGEALPMTVRPR